MENNFQQQKTVSMSDMEYYTIVTALNFFQNNCGDYEVGKLAEAVRTRLEKVQFCMGESITIHEPKNYDV